MWFSHRTPNQWHQNRQLHEIIRANEPEDYAHRKWEPLPGGIVHDCRRGELMPPATGLKLASGSSQYILQCSSVTDALNSWRLLFPLVIPSEEIVRSRMIFTAEGSAVEDKYLLRLHHGQPVAEPVHGNYE